MNYMVKDVKYDGDIAEYLAKVTQVVYDKDEPSSYPDRLLTRLAKESYGDTASHVLSFVPCILKGGDYDYFNTLKENTSPIILDYYGYEAITPTAPNEQETIYVTSARELLNVGFSIEQVAKVVDFSYFRTVTMVMPNFAYAQLRTHSKVVMLQQSNRYTTSKYGYWYPPEFADYYLSNSNVSRYEMTSQEYWDNMVEHSTPTELTAFMKDELGVKREVYSRGRDMLQIRVCSLGFDMLNPNSYQHFINERMRSSHTQQATREVVKAIFEHIAYPV